MLKWLTITLIAVLVFLILLLGLGYLLKEHKVATTQLKYQLDRERAEQTVKEAKQPLNSIIETSLVEVVEKTTKNSRKISRSIKQNILIKNLTCASSKQCVLVEIEFKDLNCTFAINTIGASLLAKSVDVSNAVGTCPSYPKNSQLSCQNNLCTYGNINN
jgi:GTPase SAR1 family protein